jgi:predicted nucleic acid-binding protein
MPGKSLVIDANILVRAVLGTRARDVIEAYSGEVNTCRHLSSNVVAIRKRRSPCYAHWAAL